MAKIIPSAIQKNVFKSVLFNEILPKRGFCVRVKVKNEEQQNFGIITSPYGACKPIPKQNLVNYVFEKVDCWSDKPAATCATSRRTYSYGMIRMLVNRFAQALIGQCGMQRNEVIGLLVPNIPEFVVVCHGAIEAGITVTYANPLYTPDEIKRQFENAGVTMIATIPQLLDVAKAIGPHLKGYKGTVCVGGQDEPAQKIYGLESLLQSNQQTQPHEIDVEEDLALLPYSSGTTGLPKGVKLTHKNLVANLVQGDHPEMLEEATTDYFQHKTLTVLPFFHIYGFNGILNMAIREGLHMITLPKFTPEDYVKALVEHRPSYLFVVPSLLLFLASHPAVKTEHLSSVQSVMSGAAPLTEGLLQKFRQKLGRDDVRIRQGYGMTEASPVVMCMPKSTPASKVGTVGVLSPGTEAKVLSLTTGEPLGCHQSGELLVRGPQVMKGYLNNEKATMETLDEEGWLHTGDVVYYDEDGYFFIVDRCKELIKVKGNQVSPTELENIIHELPQVADVAVVGIPDSLSGEVPKAFVVKKPNAEIEEKDITEYVNAKVTKFKRLAGGVKFVDAIPRNPNGKVMRNELKIAK